MKILSLATGLLLLFLVLISSGLMLIASNIFTIQKIDCYNEGKKCPDSLIQEIESQLLTKSFFITDFSKELLLANVEVNSFSKQLPGIVSLQVAAKTTDLTLNRATSTISEKEATHFLQKALEDESIGVGLIELDIDNDLLIAELDTKTALLTFSNLENDTTKLITILKNLDLETIDLAIVEIDVRYRLPVLRTSKSER